MKQQSYKVLIKLKTKCELKAYNFDNPQQLTHQMDIAEQKCVWSDSPTKLNLTR